MIKSTHTHLYIIHHTCAWHTVNPDSESSLTHVMYALVSFYKGISTVWVDF